MSVVQADRYLGQASAFTWAHVPRGEPRFAPAPSRPPSRPGASTRTPGTGWSGGFTVPRRGTYMVQGRPFTGHERGQSWVAHTRCKWDELIPWHTWSSTNVLPRKRLGRTYRRLRLLGAEEIDRRTKAPQTLVSD